MSEEVKLLPCPRCGRIDCDKIPPGQIEKTIELLKSLPRIERDQDYEEPEPSF